MVNHGVSRGCAACKRQRKKCDELRPSCTRCRKGGRVCPGYRNETELIFRHWPPPHALSGWPDSTVDDAELEADALDIFQSEFVVEPADRELSRGFLDGMPSLLKRAGPDSTLAGIAKLVALASVANRLRRHRLLLRLEEQYGVLIRDFHESLSNTDSITIESLYSAVLLGLYEIISSNESSSARQLTHVQGVGAILVSGASHLDWGSDAQIFELGIPLLLKLANDESRVSGILRASAKQSRVQALDTIMVTFWRFLTYAPTTLKGTPSVEELEQLRHEAEVLEQKFSSWSASQSDERASPAPRTVGFVNEQSADASKIAYCHVGEVDVYLDYYVATVWNTYRKSHMYILDVMLQIDSRLQPEAETRSGLASKAKGIVASLIASVPFLLAADANEYLDHVNAGSSQVRPNRPVGGLLLVHPLYCVATNPIVPLATRKYCLRCLEWIGIHMGIGQAAVLAKSLDFAGGSARLDPDPRLPFQAMSESNNLIWAGMLLQPT